MTDYRRPTGNELRDLLPHGGFSIDTRRLDTRTVVVVHCHCGRRLDMLDSLPSTILFYWLADHDDEMFLMPDEIKAKHEATIAPLTGMEMPFHHRPQAQMIVMDWTPTDPEPVEKTFTPFPALPEGGRPLLHDPDSAMGERP